MDTKQILDNIPSFQSEGCSLAFALSDIKRKAGCIRKISEEKIEDDQWAKIHCSNLADWMKEIEKKVDQVLNEAIKSNKS